jgi:hypothetical protein
MAAVFTNASGQEPSPPAPDDYGMPTPGQIEAMKRARDWVKAHPEVVAARAASSQGMLRGRSSGPRFHPRIVARVGRDGIDIARCQAPLRGRAGKPTIRCERAATGVIVENKARPDGSIGGMALCDLCYGAVLATQGPDYAKHTPLTHETVMASEFPAKP